MLASGPLLNCLIDQLAVVNGVSVAACLTNVLPTAVFPAFNLQCIIVINCVQCGDLASLVPSTLPPSHTSVPSQADRPLCSSQSTSGIRCQMICIFVLYRALHTAVLRANTICTAHHSTMHLFALTIMAQHGLHTIAIV